MSRIGEYFDQHPKADRFATIALVASLVTGAAVATNEAVNTFHNGIEFEQPIVDLSKVYE